MNRKEKKKESDFMIPSDSLRCDGATNHCFNEVWDDEEWQCSFWNATSSSACLAPGFHSTGLHNLGPIVECDRHPNHRFPFQ